MLTYLKLNVNPKYIILSKKGSPSPTFLQVISAPRKGKGFGLSGTCKSEITIRAWSPFSFKLLTSNFKLR